VTPGTRLCCGRPLYDFGLLDDARALLQRIVHALADDIRSGVPLVGLEPGCLSVFKDELIRQLPGDPVALQLSQQSFLFADFVAHADFDWPRLEAQVVVHGHCHQKSLFGMSGDTALLDRLGVRWTLLDTGCCGMAGSFGFDAGHYTLSTKVAGDRLLPLLREVPADAIVVANGFSCREQIDQLAGRKPLHIAQLAQRALAQSQSSHQHAVRLRSTRVHTGLP
jgi:Fe-S oxidoreductase